MAARNDATAEDERIRFRVGINSGDVIVGDGDIHGDGVNIAARLEGIAEPGGVCISGIVYDQVQGRLDCAFAYIGDQRLKNIARPVRAYRVALTHPSADAPGSPSPANAGGIDFGHRALEIARNDPVVLADAAYALACFGEDIDAMIALVDRALAFNPSYARGWHNSGFMRLWAGQADLAIEHAGRALRLSPRAQARGSSWLIGAALFFSQRFQEAAPRMRTAIEETPLFPTPYRFLAACYAHMGLLDEARATIARLRAITPEVIPNYPLPFRDPQHRALYFSGLRLAMGETE